MGHTGAYSTNAKAQNSPFSDLFESLCRSKGQPLTGLVQHAVAYLHLLGIPCNTQGKITIDTVYA